MVHPIEILHPRNLSHLYKNVGALVAGRLWLKVIIGMVLGALVGYLLSPGAGLIGKELADTVGSWVALPGRVFLTVVQMIVVPLIFASVIRGIASNNSINQLKSTGLKLVTYFLLTTTVAILIGVSLASVIRPGDYIDLAAPQTAAVTENVEEELSGEEEVGGFGNLPSAIVGLLPNNPFSDAVEANMLQIVLFSIIVGLALVTLPPAQSKPLLDLTGSVLEVSMTIVRWIMVIAPYAVFGLIAQLVINTGLETFVGIGVFVGTVMLGLVCLLLFYLVIAFAFGRWKPWTYIANIREAMLLAFSTDSSAATMPVSLKTVQDKLKVRPSIAQFVVPIGATVNMDATALFQGLATIFFVQMYGLDVSIAVLAVLIVTIIGSSIGASATPGVGIVVLSVVLGSVGIPLEGLALIIGVDQILERFRAMLNVTGDLTASVVMERLSPDRAAYKDEMKEDRALEKKRKSTGDDVILKPASKANVKAA